MACSARFEDDVESVVELVPADLRQRRPVEIDERGSDRRPGIEWLQSRAIERKLSDMSRGGAVRLFAQFEVDDRYTLVGCDKPIETPAISQVGAPRPRQNARQRDFAARPGAKNGAQLRGADRRQDP